jgi:hypothetical protein
MAYTLWAMTEVVGDVTEAGFSMQWQEANKRLADLHSNGEPSAGKGKIVGRSVETHARVNIELHVVA